MDTEQFSNVADPLEDCPTVFGPMHAENQQKIFQREGTNCRPCKGYCRAARPQTGKIERERPIPPCEGPMHLYMDAAIISHKGIMVVVFQYCLLSYPGQRELVSVCDKQVFGFLDVLFGHQNIKAAELRGV